MAGMPKKDHQNRMLQLESLELRQLLSGDGIAPDSGVVTGIVWNDADSNRVQDADEIGMPGIQVFADSNENGRLDADEPTTVTQRDNPITRVDESGRYEFELPSGKHTIRQVVLDGYSQTFPVGILWNPFDDLDLFSKGDEGFETIPPVIFHESERGDVFETEAAVIFHPTCIRPFELDVKAVGPDGGDVDGVEVVNQSGVQLNGCGGDVSSFQLEIITEDPSVPYQLGFFDVLGGNVVATIPVIQIPGVSDGGHQIKVEPGSRHDGLNFGNALNAPQTASIEGRKFLDENGNGLFDEGEKGLGGVQVYIDANNNGTLDRDRGFEHNTTTRFDDPSTAEDEGGLYSFAALRPGEYTVREIVPEGYVQTYPTIASDVVSSVTGKFNSDVSAALDFDVTDVKFKTDGENSQTEIELTVQWPDGCGLLEGESTYSVIGNTILVDVRGGVHEGPCTTAATNTSTAISIANLNAGDYNVVGTLHIGEETALGVVGEIEIGKAGSHTVSLEAGDSAILDFGNNRLGLIESVQGVIWNDANGDGIQQAGEGMMGGVTVYADLNVDGSHDENEPSAVTSSDPDQLGAYKLDLGPGFFQINQTVPDGFQQTYPDDSFFVHPWIGEDGEFPFQTSNQLVIFPGGQIEGIDFGNQSTEPGSVSGTKWLDANGNGSRDEGEVGLAGVTVYVDTNSNGQFDDSDPSAVTGETGSYQIKDVKPGRYFVNEVVPEGYAQTYPRQTWFEFGGLPPDLLFDSTFTHFVHVSPGEEVAGIDFGNQKITPGSISGTKWLDANGNGQRDDGDIGLAGVTIYIDANLNGQLDEGERSTVSASDDPDTAKNELGSYRFDNVEALQRHSVREVVPEGYQQTFPFPFEWLEFNDDGTISELPFDFTLFFSAHNVIVGSGEIVTGIDFGNYPKPEPALLSGSVWADADGNGQRDGNENGLENITVFADTNGNGRRDDFEPFTTSSYDIPETDFDESGLYDLKVSPGEFAVIAERPLGLKQTFPKGPHLAEVGSGDAIGDINFGFQKVEGNGEISGRVWFDNNANGLQDRGEAPVNGVQVYLDLNNNGGLDGDEPVRITGQNLDPATGVTAGAGAFAFDVEPGDYTVRQVLDRGFIQTYPNGFLDIGDMEISKLGPSSSSLVDVSIESIDVATTSANDGGLPSATFVLNTVWSAADARVRAGYSIDGDQLSINLYGNATGQDAAVLVDNETSIRIDGLELRDYEVKVSVYEESVNTTDEELSGLGLSGRIVFEGDDAHRISIGADRLFGSASFGRIAVPVDPLDTPIDSKMGDDPHVGLHNDSATHIEFHDDHAMLNSYVDSSEDQDVFQFVGNGHFIVGEGTTAGDEVEFELLGPDGEVISKGSKGTEFGVKTEVGETYYVRVSGSEGNYQLNLVQQALPNTEGPDVIEGDTDGDGDVDFADFLVLSTNFGQQVDEAFADGDFNDDGEVTFADFLALSVNFGESLG